MKQFRWIVVVLVCAALLVLAGAAGAQAPVLHERTMQIPGTQCSVTAWDYYTTVSGTYTMHYGGGTSCAGNVGQRTLNVVPQVFNLVNGEPLWFSIGGDGLYQGPTPISPLRLSRSRTAVPSHIYRLLAYGQVTLPSGETFSLTVCASCQGTAPKLSIAPPRGFVYSTPATTVQLRGLPCSVSQFGASFPYINNTPIMNYGGDLSCAPSFTGQRSLEIAAQVAGPGPSHALTYYTITGSTLSVGPTTNTYITLYTGRTAYIGHPYRAIAIGTVTYKGKTTTATAYSKTTGP